jgi:flavorubredoxin
MEKVQVAEGVYWVGVVDWDRRTFHGAHHQTPVGTTYNAYLVVDEKIALIDAVYRPFAGELLEKISQIVDPADIDYLVANHGEPDHSSSIPLVMDAAEDATLVCTKKGQVSITTQYHSDWKTQTVSSGDQISLGKKTLAFLEAPMLHWPDSMFTYVPELELLMPNDAFGQHIASNGRFDDQVDECKLMEEARGYYANILTPFSNLVLKKLEEVQKAGLKIKTIAPSHGIIWRRDPGKIISAYAQWASGEAADNNVIIAYETMWGGTEAMARSILDGLTSRGIKARMMKLSATPRSEVISELLEARGILIGSPTLNKGVSPQVAELLSELKGLRFKGRMGAAFGCYGWAGGGTKVINEALEMAGIQVAMPPLDVNWHPDDNARAECHEFGAKLADALLAPA